LIRIVLVEPMGLLRDALAAVLRAEDDLHVVAELDGLTGVEALARPVPPDLAILGLEPSDPDGADTVRRLREQLPDSRILVLTGRKGAHRLRRALGSRALNDLVRGLIDKDTTPPQLVRHIREVAEGQRVVDPRLLPSLTLRDNPLTGRERDVMRLAVLGMPAAEIAVNLDMSTGTVRGYLSAIVRKTGARTLVEAARIARDAGWL
jgi:two-component system response regulator DesR